MINRPAGAQPQIAFVIRENAGDGIVRRMQAQIPVQISARDDASQVVTGRAQPDPTDGIFVQSVNGPASERRAFDDGFEFAGLAAHDGAVVATQPEAASAMAKWR